MAAETSVQTIRHWCLNLMSLKSERDNCQHFSSWLHNLSVSLSITSSIRRLWTFLCHIACLIKVCEDLCTNSNAFHLLPNSNAVHTTMDCGIQHFVHCYKKTWSHWIALLYTTGNFKPVRCFPFSHSSGCVLGVVEQLLIMLKPPCQFYLFIQNILMSNISQVEFGQLILWQAPWGNMKLFKASIGHPWVKVSSASFAFCLAYCHLTPLTDFLHSLLSVAQSA